MKIILDYSRETTELAESGGGRRNEKRIQYCHQRYRKKSQARGKDAFRSLTEVQTVPSYTLQDSHLVDVIILSL